MWRHVFVGLVAVCCWAVVLLLMAAMNAAWGAEVERGLPCGLYGVDPPGTAHVVFVRWVPTGIGLFVCRGRMPPPGVHVRYDFASTGAECAVGQDYTTDWRQVVSPDGDAVLTCILHP